MELEYNSSPKIIKSSFGYMDQETSSFPLRIIGEDEIDRAPNLNSVIVGRFAGVNAFCNLTTDELIVKMRSIQSVSSHKSIAVFDVDGVVLTKVNCSQLLKCEENSLYIFIDGNIPVWYTWCGRCCCNQHQNRHSYST